MKKPAGLIAVSRALLFLYVFIQSFTVNIPVFMTIVSYSEQPFIIEGTLAQRVVNLSLTEISVILYQLPTRIYG